MTEPAEGALPAELFIVATPIGNASDLTLRAIDILRRADVLAAEDTRRLRKLMEIHGIPLAGRRVQAYHDHNGARARPALLAALSEGKSVAYASDAGTPLVADPGFALARDAIAAGHEVRAAPGASALLAALAVAGLPTDRFMFAGFVPQKDGARMSFLQEMAQVPATLVVFESPRRLAATLEALARIEPDRRAAVCRELTKRFEEVRRGTVSDLGSAFAEEADPKGEIVLVLGPPAPREIGDEAVDRLLAAALETASVKDAATEVAQQTGRKRREVYARAQALRDALGKT